MEDLSSLTVLVTDLESNVGATKVVFEAPDCLDGDEDRTYMTGHIDHPAISESVDITVRTTDYVRGDGLDRKHGVTMRFEDWNEYGDPDELGGEGVIRLFQILFAIDG